MQGVSEEREGHVERQSRQESGGNPLGWDQGGWEGWEKFGREMEPKRKVVVK